jgi:hypothetical protein
MLSGWAAKVCVCLAKRQPGTRAGIAPLAYAAS